LFSILALEETAKLVDSIEQRATRVVNPTRHVEGLDRSTMRKAKLQWPAQAARRAGCSMAFQASGNGLEGRRPTGLHHGGYF